MEKEKIATNAGTIDVPSITFDREIISVSFDITEIPADIMEKINAMVEVEKINHYMNHLKAKNLEWVQSGVEIEFTYLNVVISTTEASTYCIIAGFKDLENASLESEINLDIDLSGHETVLREIITRELVKKFLCQSPINLS